MVIKSPLLHTKGIFNMRLNKFLSSCGVDSRRKCEQYILDGRVAVNGKIVSNLSTVVDEKKR